MSRRPILLLSVAAVVLLGIGFVLWRAIRSDADSIAAPPTRTEVATHAPPPATAPGPVAAAPSRPAPREVTRTPSAAARPAPTAATPIDAGIPDNDPNAPLDDTDLHFGGEQFHAVATSVEPLVRECVDRAVRSGKHPSGTALLTYTAVKHGDKVTVDETGVDAAKTTLADDSLLSCLHQTAKAMKLEGLPRNANTIWAARTVTIEAGKITEYRHATFSYYRPTPPP